MLLKDNYSKKPTRASIANYTNNPDDADIDPNKINKIMIIIHVRLLQDDGLW